MGPNGFLAFRTVFQPTQPSSYSCVSLRGQGGRRCWREAVRFHDNCVGGVGSVTKLGLQPLIPAPARGCSGSANYYP